MLKALSPQLFVSERGTFKIRLPFDRKDLPGLKIVITSVKHLANVGKIDIYPAINIILFVYKLVPRVFLRHTMITKPNEYPGKLRSN